MSDLPSDRFQVGKNFIDLTNTDYKRYRTPFILENTFTVTAHKGKLFLCVQDHDFIVGKKLIGKTVTLMDKDDTHDIKVVDVERFVKPIGLPPGEKCPPGVNVCIVIEQDEKFDHLLKRKVKDYQTRILINNKDLLMSPDNIYL